MTRVSGSYSASNKGARGSLGHNITSIITLHYTAVTTRRPKIISSHAYQFETFSIQHHHNDGVHAHDD